MQLSMSNAGPVVESVHAKERHARADAPLDAAHGILLSCLLGSLLWVPIIGVVWVLLV